MRTNTSYGLSSATAFTVAMLLILGACDAHAVAWGVKSHDPVSGPPSTLFTLTNGVFGGIGTTVRRDGIELDVDGLALDSAQVLFGFEILSASAGSQLIRIETPGGAATSIGPVLSGREIRGAAFTHTGRLLALDATADELVEIDAATGLVVGAGIPLTENAAPYALSTVCDLVETGEGDLLVANSSQFLSLDAGTGAMTLLHTDTGIGADGYGVGIAGLILGADAGGPDLLGAYDVTQDDDVYSYAPGAGFARAALALHIYPGYNAGRGDLASTPPAVTAVSLDEAASPGRPAAWIRPNPASSGAEIGFTLASAAAVDVTVHDLAGRPVRHLASGAFPAGRHALRWNGDDDRSRRVAPGLYLVQVRAGARSTVARLALVR